MRNPVLTKNIKKNLVPTLRNNTIPHSTSPRFEKHNSNHRIKELTNQSTHTKAQRKKGNHLKGKRRRKRNQCMVGAIPRRITELDRRKKEEGAFWNIPITPLRNPNH